MSKKIPDFTASQTWTIESPFKERFKENMPPLSGLYRESENSHFVIFKSGQSKYRCPFFYPVHRQYGTGIEEYDEIKDCITSLPRVQFDYARNTQQESASSH